MSLVLSISTEKADSAFLSKAEEMDLILSSIKIPKVFQERAEMKMQSVFAISQSKEWAEPVKSNLPSSRTPSTAPVTFPHSAGAPKHPLLWQCQWQQLQRGLGCSVHWTALNPRPGNLCASRALCICAGTEIPIEFQSNLTNALHRKPALILTDWKI